MVLEQIFGTNVGGHMSGPSLFSRRTRQYSEPNAAAVDSTGNKECNEVALTSRSSPGVSRVDLVHKVAPLF